MLEILLKLFLFKHKEFISYYEKNEKKNFRKNAKKLKFNKIVTLTGFNKKNNLKKLGDCNLWVNSKDYNVVENIHQVWLLMLVDMIKAKNPKLNF